MPQGSELERPLLGMGPPCELKGNKALILTFSRCLCLGQVRQPALRHLVPGLRARSPSRDGGGSSRVSGGGGLYTLFSPVPCWGTLDPELGTMARAEEMTQPLRRCQSGGSMGSRRALWLSMLPRPRKGNICKG